MEGDPIASLNTGLAQFETELKEDKRAQRSARVMLIRVGGFQGDAKEVNVIAEFQDVSSFSVAPQVASGETPLGEAVLLGLQKIEEEKAYLRSKNLNYVRPWLFVISDGEPTDVPKYGKKTWPEACATAHDAIKGKKVSIFAIAVNAGNADELQNVTTRSVRKMESMNFKEFFIWLSNSIGDAGNSAEEEPPMAPGRDDWETTAH
jgi:uncharacterized protein YegL